MVITVLYVPYYIALLFREHTGELFIAPLQVPYISDGNNFNKEML